MNDDSKNIRVAHVNNSLEIGGLETGLLNVIRNVDRSEFEHGVFCIRGLGPNADRVRELGGRVELVGDDDAQSRRIISGLVAAFHRFRPDVVHTRGWAAVDGIIAARIARVPAVVHGIHGWDKVDPEGTLKKRRAIRGVLSPFVSRFYCVSDHMKRWLEGHRGFFRNKVRTICNGVDTDRFAPAAERTRGQGGEVVLGTVARFVPIKDQPGLIRAFVEVAGDFPDARLLLVGGGPLEDDLRAQARATAFHDRIAFTGFTENVEEHYARMDLFCLPSLNEGISNTILEAMAAGLPVLATNVGGNPELVVDGETGKLVPREETGILAAGMREYLADRARLGAHGRAGRARAVTDFSLAKMAAGYRQLYLDALRGRRARR